MRPFFHERRRISGLNYVLYLLFVTVLPVLIGRWAVPEEDGRDYTIPGRWCAGFVMMLAAAWVPACLGILLGKTLTWFIIIWLILIMTPAVLSAAMMLKTGENPFLMVQRLIKGGSLMGAAAFLLPAAHAVVTFLMMHIDDDDVHYVGAVTTAVDTNTLMRYDAVSGNLILDFAKNEMNRLVAAPQFSFYAAVSKLFHIRPAVLCHTFMPPVLTMLFYAAFLTAGYELFSHDRKKASLFTVFVFLINMSSYFSVYTAGTFLMIRSWQGKAQIVGLVFPLLFALAFRIINRGSMTAPDVLFLSAILGAASLLTSMGAVFACAAAGLLLLLAAVRKRKPSILFFSLPAFAIPAAMLVVYYVVL